MRAALLLLAACSGSPPPVCPSPLPSQLTDSMEPLEWSDSTGCIAITYDPAFREREAMLIDAVHQWIDVACKRTCFSDPIERATPDDGKPALQSIHFAPLDPTLPQQTTAKIFARVETGQIDRVLVSVDPTLLEMELRHAILRGFGRALGFDEPAMDVESVMHPDADITELSEEDRTAFCAKYGTCL